MPYQTTSDLPQAIKNHLPAHAQEIFRATFNRAWEEYDDRNKFADNNTREETAHRVAWSVVKKKYAKKGDQWIKRE